MNLPDGKPILESHTWCPGCDESNVENASHYACKAVLEHMAKADSVMKAAKAIREAFLNRGKTMSLHRWDQAMKAANVELEKALAEYGEVGE